MTIKIAEYLGQMIEGQKAIEPAIHGDLCPFMNSECPKVKERQKPICSVRKSDGQLLIACKYRICPSIKSKPLSQYSKSFLLSIAHLIWIQSIEARDVLIKSNVNVSLTNDDSYNADFIMICDDLSVEKNRPQRIVLEMQKPHEIYPIENIKGIVEKWESHHTRNNTMLNEAITAIIELNLNTWLKQQEYFTLKCHTIFNSGGAAIFCVNPILFDSLKTLVDKRNINYSKCNYWNLAFLFYSESSTINRDQIILDLDPTKAIFTNYHRFLLQLNNEWDVFPEMFKGKFDSL